MKANGIPIHAVTPQNEPLNAGNNPSLYMQASDEAAFIKNNLAPAFKAAGIETKIIVYDHNCDHTDYPLSIYNDAAALNAVDGAAFHLYAGDIGALSTVHNMYPAKNLYFYRTIHCFHGRLWRRFKMAFEKCNHWLYAQLEPRSS